jgi:hypothetical protein
MLAFFRKTWASAATTVLTDFKEILGFPVQRAHPRGPVHRVRRGAGGGYLICRFIIASKLGKVLVAIRDAESRTPLPRLPGRELQARGVHDLGDARRRRGRALRAPGRHHQPGRVRARQLHRGGDLGRGRRDAARWRARRSARSS